MMLDAVNFIKRHPVLHFMAITLKDSRGELQIKINYLPIWPATIFSDQGQRHYLTGERPITAELVDSVLSRKLDDLEPTLTRHGYRLKDMVEQFDAKPAEIRALFNHQLDPTRTAELRDRILAAGLPI